MLIPHFGDKKNQTLMLVSQRTSWTSKIHEEMIAEVPINREKSENGFHFCSIPPLPLPSGEKGTMGTYELK
jgi:hypothetical protein